MKDIMCDIDDIGKMEPVKESYFGKSAELLECERLIKIMIGKLKVSDNKLPARAVDTKISDWKENKAICVCLQKQFGFKEMYLHWSGEPVENAFSGVRGIITMTSGSGSGMPSVPLKLSNGTYYDTDHNYLCAVNIYAGLIDMGMTAEEIVAVILHEIGHNFDVSLLAITSDIVEASHLAYSIANYGKHATDLFKMLYDILPRIQNWIIGQNMSSYLKDMLQQIDAYIDDNKNQLMKRWEIWLRDVQKTKMYPLFWVMFIVVYNMSNDIWLHGLYYAVWNNAAGYSREVFSDSFATAFGYGPATVSVQSKFTTDTRLTKLLYSKNNPKHAYNEYATVIAGCMLTLIDPHPMCQTRMKNQINMLKSEMKASDIPPSIKAAIQRDLDNAQKIYDTQCLHTQEENATGAMIALARFNEKFFGGKMELRDIFVRILNLGSSNA